MGDKKLAAVVVVTGSRSDTLKIMFTVMDELNKRGIKTNKTDTFRIQFETPNIIVRYIFKRMDLIGLCPDEIFGTFDDELLYYRRNRLDTKPYKGSIIDYILEVEKAAEAEESRLEQRDITPDELVYFAENVLGIELMDCQKAVLKAWADLRKSFGGKPAKVCYGKIGKVYVFPEK